MKVFGLSTLVYNQRQLFLYAFIRSCFTLVNSI